MRKTLVVLLSSTALIGLVLGLIGFYVSCGSTGGGDSGEVGIAAASQQFVSLSCAPGGSRCLTLAAPNTVPADGKTRSGFFAQLLDGSGRPIDNVKLCFHFEDPDVAIIFEPVDNCGLTGLDGRVSGQFRDGTRPGSFTLIVDAPPGFNLQARARISFNGVSPAPGQKGDIGSTCQTDGDCSAAPVKLFCTFNDVCFPGGTTCEAGNGDGGCCTSGVECASQTCDTSRTRCVPSTGGGTGAPCATNSNCNADGGLFCTFQDICFSGQPSCQPKNATGGCCTNNSECSSSSGCDTKSQKCLPPPSAGGPGDICGTDTDCKASLFCSFGDPQCPAYGTSVCTAKQPPGGCCTANTECANANTCDIGSNTCTAPLPTPTASPVPTAAPPTAPPSPTPTPSGVGGHCNSDGECQVGLFCGIGDGCSAANTCSAKKTSGCCTVQVECVTSCTAGTCT